MVGGIVGAAVGTAQIPQQWLSRLMEPFCTVRWLEALATQLEESVHSGISQRAIAIPWPVLFCRNLLFLLLIVGHGLRRLLPPY